MYTKMSDEEKLRVIERRIVNEVMKYHAEFAKGQPMHNLSLKYGKALMPLGGFPELLKNMDERGLISIDVKESGARSVSPPRKDNVVTLKQIPPKDWF